MNAPLAAHPILLDRQEVGGLVLAPSLERRRLQCYLAQLIVDCCAILAGFGLFGYFYLGYSGLTGALVRSQLVLPLFLTVALYDGAYSLTALDKPGKGIWQAIVALGVSASAVVFIAFLTKSSTEFSRLFFVGGVSFSAMILIWARVQMRSFVRWRCGATVMNELVINDGGPRLDFPGAIQVCAESLRLTPDLKDPHALDRIGLVLRNIDRVVVSCPPEKRVAWAMMLKGANVEGEVLDEQVVQLGAQGARVAANQGLLLVSAGPLGIRARAAKRVFDLVLSASALVFLSPLLLFVALAIKLEDGGPVLFVQRRLGRGNRFFDMYKFRSMSESLSDQDGNVSASRQDTRLTRVGRFIRMTSIDELPQLINVVLGDMSLVGPRPHAIGSQAGDKLFWEVDMRYWQRHCLKPGLSGLAQIRGYRGATEQEMDLVNRLQSDLEYLEGWTIVRDVKIILLTLRVLIHDRAY